MCSPFCQSVPPGGVVVFTAVGDERRVNPKPFCPETRAKESGFSGVVLLARRKTDSDDPILEHVDPSAPRYGWFTR